MFNGVHSLGWVAALGAAGAVLEGVAVEVEVRVVLVDHLENADVLIKHLS